MTQERRSGVYARRRDLRLAPLPPPPPGTLAAWVPSPPDHVGPPAPARSVHADAGVSGPSTQELELHRAAAPPPVPRPFDGGFAELTGVGATPADRGERARVAVERWSAWAAGLGKPPRDRSGRRRYPGGDSLLPPAVLIAAGLGFAGLAGLLGGFLLSSPGGGTAAGPAPTVTVTQQVVPPAVTETQTRTRTHTVTTTASPQAPDAAAVLQPGSQGPAVMQLQQDLAALGLYQGRPSGTYDEETRAGVQAFQGGFGVAGDPPGVAGPATLAAVARAVGRA